ncbi:hypothetical protein V6N11_076397 [Hibiscus sabdariffa]|uniref:Uncharacterized protein n=1 Tax=Hibiscus sabdariffa TaxID=183260 RepID=A0ABR2Q6M9_9ROSI
MEKESSFMQILFCKLKRLKSALSRFNAEHYGGISLRVRDKARELEEVQLLNLHETVDDSLLEKEKELYKELKVQQKFTIRSLKTEEGVIPRSQTEIADETIRFFQNLVGSSDGVVSGCSLQLLQGLIGTSFSDGARVALSKMVTREEIKAAMFEQNGDKAPGPDGYTASFFQAAWSVEGKDVINAVL